MMGGHGFWMWGMWIIPLIIILAIIFSVKNNSSAEKQNPESPLEILKKRYAKGEITKEQFEEIKKYIS